MEKGKKVCEYLKGVRKKVAQENGIEYEPTECSYEGDCPGTCPKCDAELEELQHLLDEKSKTGMPIRYGDGKSLNDAEQGSSMDNRLSWRDFRTPGAVCPEVFERTGTFPDDINLIADGQVEIELLKQRGDISYFPKSGDTEEYDYGDE